MELIRAYYTRVQQKYFSKAKLWTYGAVLGIVLSYAGAYYTAKQLKAIENQKPAITTTAEAPDISNVLLGVGGTLAGIVLAVGSVVKVRKSLDDVEE